MSLDGWKVETSTVWWAVAALLGVCLLGWVFGLIAARFNPTKEEAALIRALFGGERDL